MFRPPRNGRDKAQPGSFARLDACIAFSFQPLSHRIAIQFRTDPDCNTKPQRHGTTLHGIRQSRVRSCEPVRNWCKGMTQRHGTTLHDIKLSRDRSCGPMRNRTYWCERMTQRHGTTLHDIRQSRVRSCEPMRNGIYWCKGMPLRLPTTACTKGDAQRRIERRCDDGR